MEKGLSYTCGYLTFIYFLQCTTVLCHTRDKSSRRAIFVSQVLSAHKRIEYNIAFSIYVYIHMYSYMYIIHIYCAFLKVQYCPGV